VGESGRAKGSDPGSNERRFPPGDKCGIGGASGNFTAGLVGCLTRAAAGQGKDIRLLHSSADAGNGLGGMLNGSESGERSGDQPCFGEGDGLGDAPGPGEADIPGDTPGPGARLDESESGEWCGGQLGEALGLGDAPGPGEAFSLGDAPGPGDGPDRGDRSQEKGGSGELFGEPATFPNTSCGSVIEKGPRALGDFASCPSGVGWFEKLASCACCPSVKTLSPWLATAWTTSIC